MVGLDYQASLNTLIIGPASDTGFGLVASARPCKVAEAMNSSPSSGTPHFSQGGWQVQLPA